jgi:hypothetical protein
MLNDSYLINRILIATILDHLTANEGKGDSIQAMKTYIRRVEVQLLSFITLAPHDGNWLVSRTSCFTPQGKHSLLYPLKEGRMGPRHFGEEINILPLPGFTTQIVHLIT